MRSTSLTAPCPCGHTHAGRPLPLASCCGLYLDDEQQTAPTPLALMRSRYTAYVLERAPYLLTTWHPDHRPAELVFEPGLKWLGLEVRSFSQSDNTGRVHFVARVRDASGRANRIEERSRFVLLSGRWLYLDGLA